MKKLSEMSRGPRRKLGALGSSESKDMNKRTTKDKRMLATNHFAHFLHQIIYLKVIIFVNNLKRNVH